MNSCTPVHFGLSRRTKLRIGKFLLLGMLGTAVYHDGRQFISDVQTQACLTDIGSKRTIPERTYWFAPTTYKETIPQTIKHLPGSTFNRTKDGLRGGFEWAILKTLGAGSIPLSGRGFNTMKPEMKTALVETAAELGMNPNHLAAVIDFETAGTFSPKIKNPHNGAGGLIQFTKTNQARFAKRLKTTPEKILAMSAPEQLRTVVKMYFADIIASRGGQPLDSLEEVYMAVFYPMLMEGSKDTLVAACPSQTYKFNAGMDKDVDAQITGEDVADKIREYAKIHGYIGM